MQYGLESETEYILKEVKALFKKPVVMWAGGKDSTAHLFMVRQTFGYIPWPVLFIDTGYKFRETYEFIDRIKKAWDINLIVAENREAKEKGISPYKNDKFECCTKLKTYALRDAIKEHGFDAVLVSIRWDEHGVRGKERYFSPRSNPDHIRVHPILHWSEPELWNYIRKKNIPMNPLYGRVEHGNLVYRSIGCYTCTKPIPKAALGERDGRAQDKEEIMEQLRALGYM